MTRDEKTAVDIRSTSVTTAALHATVETYEQHADAARADLHAVLYGKVADALTEAREALERAADLLDPNTTDVSGYTPPHSLDFYRDSLGN